MMMMMMMVDELYYDIILIVDVVDLQQFHQLMLAEHVTS